MDLIHDDRRHRGQHLATTGTGEQQIQRLRRRYQDMGWVFRHLLPLISGCVACSHPNSDIHRWQPQQVQLLSNAIQRHIQILVNVVTQRFEG